MQSTYFCQISKVFLLECVIVFVNAEKLLIASITFLASAFGKDWILLMIEGVEQPPQNGEVKALSVSVP